MPGVAGSSPASTTRQALRSCPRRRADPGLEILVIAISGLSAAAPGFFARLEKPFSFSRLAAVVADAVVHARDRGT